jgi:hypothetical protein
MGIPLGNWNMAKQPSAFEDKRQPPGQGEECCQANRELSDRRLTMRRHAHAMRDQREPVAPRKEQNAQGSRGPVGSPPRLAVAQAIKVS